MSKSPNWQEANQLAIYEHGQGVEIGTTEKQIQLVAGAGLELGTSGMRVRRANHSATLPPRGLPRGPARGPPRCCFLGRKARIHRVHSNQIKRLFYTRVARDSGKH